MIPSVVVFRFAHTMSVSSRLTRAARAMSRVEWESGILPRYSPASASFWHAVHRRTWLQRIGEMFSLRVMDSDAFSHALCGQFFKRDWRG